MPLSAGDPVYVTDSSAAHSRPDPDPSETAGQLSGTAPDAHKAPNMGPVSGNRTPMVITLAVLAFVVLAIAVITGASFLPS